jgi:hypothetical protein
VPGGTHSPHQPKAEWRDKFKGKFDMGWMARLFKRPDGSYIKGKSVVCAS